MAARLALLLRGRSVCGRHRLSVRLSGRGSRCRGAPDAIVVLSGGQHRLDEGVRLWRQGVAPTLAISDGRNPSWPQANRLCGRPRVRCFDPSPYSTRGEARWTAAQGWDSVVVVTSTYHVRRARDVRPLRGRPPGRRRGRAAARQPHRRHRLGVAEIRLVLGLFARLLKVRPLHFGGCRQFSS